MSVIRYFERHQIDADKWDRCVGDASNELIYGYSWYLDAATDHQWSALVSNDYEAVMPLPWRKKWSFKYIYTPHFCNPLGIFSRLQNYSVEDFLIHIPSTFRLWDLHLNLGVKNPIGNFQCIKRQNHVLDLSADYESISKKFRTSYKQIFNKKDALTLRVEMNIAVEDVIVAARKEEKAQTLKDDDYNKLLKLHKQSATRSIAETIGVYDQNKLLASAIFFKSKSRLYYILAGNDPMGRPAAASHHLINAIIKKYAGQNLLLDFEGSDIPGIAFFFEGFGATAETYYYIHQNSLPWWCRWLKKANKGV